MKWNRLLGICVLALVCLNAQFLKAQSGGGAVVGTVHDPSGAVIPKAKVVLTNVGTGVTFATQSTSAGVYNFPAVPVGAYTVTVSAPGFQQTVSNNVIVALAKTDTVDVALQVGAASSTVHVQAVTAQLDTNTSVNSTTIDQQTYDNLPFGMYGGARSVTAIATVMPGVSMNDGASYQQQGSTSSQMWAQTIAGGQTFAGAAMLYDGIPMIVMNQSSSYTTQPVPVEALGEFSLAENNFSPEFGQTPGGIMSFSTRVGTNAFHGEAYEYIRNNDLDAAGYFAPGPGAPPNHQNEFGVNVGGPVSIPHLFNGRDRLFFFAYYSGFRLAQSSPYSGETIPTLAEQGGDFSALLSGGNNIPIYDPATTSCDNNGVCTRQQFDYHGNPNVIPPDRISNVAKVWNSYLLAPQNSNLTNNVFVTGPNDQKEDRWGGRVDYHLGQNDQIDGFFGLAPYTIESYTNAFKTGMAPYGGSVQPNYFGMVRLGWDHTFTPNLLLHLGGGWNRLSANSTPVYNDNFIDYGIPGELANVTPSMYFLPGSYADNGGTGGTLEKEHAYAYTGFVSWTKGKNTYKIGGMFWMGRDYYLSESSMTDRLISLETAQPAQGNISAIGGDPYASMMAGVFDSYQGGLSPFPTDNQFMYADAYFNDDYKILPRLTLNLGVRYEVPWTAHVKNNIQSTFSPDITNPGAGGLPGAMLFMGHGPNTCECNRFAATRYTLWQPRIGFAYKVNDRTVLHGGYGYYTSLTGGVGLNGFATQLADGFNVSLQNSSTNSGVTPALDASVGYPTFPQPPFIDPTVDNGIAPWWSQKNGGLPGLVSNYSLDVQHELPHGFIVDVAFVGNTAQHLSSKLDFPNQLPIAVVGEYGISTLNAPIDSQTGMDSGVPLPFPNFVSVMGSNATVAQALKPYPMYTGINVARENQGHSTYNSLQAKVQRSFRNGFSTLISYTWAKQMTDAETEIGSFNDGAQDTFSRVGEYVGAYDQAPQVLSLTYVYDLPFGYHRRWLNHGLMASLIGGWGVDGIQRYQTGSPMYQLGQDDPLPIGNGGFRPNFVPGQPLRPEWAGKFNPRIDPQLNAAAFTTPPLGTFGNVPKNLSLRTFGWYDESLGARKEFHIYESVSFQFGADFFNAFNRTNFDNINGPTYDPETTPGFGLFSIQGNAPRSIQFNAKLKF